MAKRPELGFQDDAALFGPQQNALLDAMKRAGAQDLRLNVMYGRVKKEGLGAYDQLVNAARARGIHPQMTLMGTPSYAAADWDRRLSDKHTDPRVMQQFAGEIAGHFKGRVGRYSIWNEPNWSGFLAGADNNPKAAGRVYRRLYQGGFKGIKKADKSAQVFLGEVTSSPNAKQFLASVLAGKPLKTAGFAYHPYDQPGKPTTTWDIDTLGDLQSTLARYKRQGKLQTAAGKAAPLFLTEFGYQAAEVPTAQRAAKVARAYNLAKAAGARQFVSYQMAPTVRQTVPGAPVPVDAYGGMTPGAASAKPGWVWDTNLHPELLGRAIYAASRPQPRARAARRR
jgi:hypothetical protein